MLIEPTIVKNGIFEPATRADEDAVRASDGGRPEQLSAKKLEEMLEFMPCLAMIVRGGMVVAWNSLARRQMGRGAASEENLELKALLIPLLDSSEDASREAEAGRRRYEAQLNRKRGVPIEVSVASQPIVFEGQPATLLCLLEHAARRALPGEGDATFLEDLLDGSPNASAVTHDGRVVHVNREFSRMFGYSLAEVLGCVLEDLVRPEGRRYETEMFEHEMDRKGRAMLETQRRTRTGERLEVQAITSRLRLGGEARGMLVSYRDIREQKQEEAKLLHTSLHDALTGLPNRRLFLDRADLLLARLRRRPNRGFAIFFLDLDGFKRVNDELGHAAGDALLLAVAERLKACLRPQDTVSRFGGDEFALLLDESGTAGELRLLAERLQQEIGQTFHWMNRQAVVGASIGIAKAGPRKTSAQMLREADAAMYAAKRAGKRQFAMAAEFEETRQC